MKPGDFTEFVEDIKEQVTAGELTEEEAVIKVLEKTQRIFQDLQVSNEQFMLEQTMHGTSIN